MFHRPIRITKADGTTEHFEPSKLEASLERAGASPNIQQRILRRVTRDIREDMTTEEIYRHAFDLLRQDEQPAVAARYSLKRAIFELGPSGFPFERFLSEVLKAHGWSTQTGVGMTGRCAPHEVDVLAEKHGRRIGIEAKFHNNPGTITDLKDALYVHARYEDLKHPRIGEPIHEGWLITNTRFSHNAVRYGRCVGLGLIGWDYPKGRGLDVLIERAGVHPLTCLTTLSEGEKRRLLENNIVLCKTVKTGKHLLVEHGVSPRKIPDVLQEATQLCTPVEPHPIEIPRVETHTAQ